MNFTEDIIEYGMAANKVKAELEQEIAKLRSINEALVKQVEELNRAKLKQD
jgi:hypothetical protein